MAPSLRSLSFTPFDINASLTSSLSVMHARCSPAGKAVRTSFMEWTAISTSFLKRASSISFVKSPLPPTLARGTSRILSPVVFILVRVTVIPGYLFSSSDFTQFACQRARALALVPILISFLIFPPGPLQALLFLYLPDQTYSSPPPGTYPCNGPLHEFLVQLWDGG